MKTIRLSVLWLSMILFLSACGKKEENKPAPAEQTENTEKTVSSPVEKKTQKRLRTGSLEINVPSNANDNVQPKIVQDDSNIVNLEKTSTDDAEKAARDGWRLKTKTPAGSLAARIRTDDSVTIKWMPAWIHGGTRGIRIPDVKLSPDKSLFVFLETTGQYNGPFGTRIILLNAHSWEVVGIYEFKSKMTLGCFVPGTDLFAVISEAQNELKQKRMIHFIQLTTGKSTGSLVIPQHAGTVMFADNQQRIFLNDTNDPLIHVYYPKDVFRIPTRLRMSEAGGFPVNCNDGKSFAVMYANRLEGYKLSDLNAYFSKELSGLPFPFKTVIFLPDSNGKRFFAAPKLEENRKAGCFSGGKFIEFDGQSAGLLTLMNSQILISALKAHAAIELIDIKTFRSIDRITPGDLIPRTGDVPLFAIFFVESNKTIAAMDINGSFYVLRKPKGARKWEKTLIFSAKR